MFFILISLLLVSRNDAALLLTTCDGTPTCSPSQCTNVTNAACTATTSTINVASSIGLIPCSTYIYPANNTMCTSATLRTLFAKGIGNGIKAIYCTNEFLVIHSDGTPNHADTLNLIPHPPGDSSSGATYATQCVTRGRQTQFFSFKIPLSPVELPSASLTNNVNSFLTNSMLSNVPLPKSGPVGVSVSGLPIFPAYNDQGSLAWVNCEMDGCNAHVGQNFDYHYHGDPYGANCMYSASDYTSTGAHPPLIGFSMDGFKIYGRHLNESAEGYSIALDICGGHTHGTYGYHYHSQVITQTVANSALGLTAGQTYTAYIAGPYQCWKGDISGINGFWDVQGLTAAYGSGRMGPSNLAQRSDYQYLRPSCAMTNYYAASGVTSSVNASAVIVTTTTAATTTKNSATNEIFKLTKIFILIELFLFLLLKPIY